MNTSASSGRDKSVLVMKTGGQPLYFQKIQRKRKMSENTEASEEDKSKRERTVTKTDTLAIKEELGMSWRQSMKLRELIKKTWGSVEGV